MLFTFNGRSIVCGAGNDNSGQAFRKGSITSGQSEPGWDVSSTWPGSVILTIWYTGPELDHRIELRGPGYRLENGGQEYHSHWGDGSVDEGTISGFEIHTYRDSEPRPDLKASWYTFPWQPPGMTGQSKLRNLGGSEVRYWAWLDNGGGAS